MHMHQRILSQCDRKAYVFHADTVEHTQMMAHLNKLIYNFW